MKRTVELSVEYYDVATNEMVYAVLFSGYMTRRFLYLFKSSITGDPKDDVVEYVKIAKSDTEIASNACSVCEPDQIRVMKVSSEEGIFDSRIKVLSTADKAIETITEALAKLKQNAKAYFMALEQFRN